MASRATAIPLPALRIDRVVDPKAHAFQVSASGDGLSIFIPHPRYWLHNAIRAAKRARSKMQQAFAPLPLWAAFASEATALAALFIARHHGSQLFPNRLWGTLWKVQGMLPFAKHVNPDIRAAYVAVMLAGGATASLTVLHRMTLRIVLSYTRWMDEPRGTVSAKTKLWHVLLKYVYIRGSRTPTYALQNCLPRLPVPVLSDTLTRYLASMEGVLPESEFLAVQAEAHKFEVAEGPKLQRYLKLKYYTSRNYVSDWWLQVVYLRGRDSLLINSNYFGIALYRDPPTTNQAARAATYTHALLAIKAQLDRETFPRTLLRDVVPLCMQQYALTFGTTREPGVETDRLVHYENNVSRHIIVIRRGRYYKVHAVCPRTGRPLSRLQFEAAYRGILDDAADDESTSTSRKIHIAALTALPRTEWAQIRVNLLQRDKINRVALQTIEEALFVVCLDDVSVDWRDLTACGHLGIHGDGCSRWLDKSFNLIVSADGNVLCNAEHSWGDAPTLAHIQELCLQLEAHAIALPGGLYADDGTIVSTKADQAALAAGTMPLLPPERIVLNPTKPLIEACDRARQYTAELINGLDLCCRQFTGFGKGLIKKGKCSPDAFVQMALQLAFYRDQGHVVQTYESATARLYAEGRTETIRSASVESAALVHAMSDPAATTTPARLSLLRAACDTHQRTTVMAMTGRGVDRHLFALYVVAVGTGVDAPFLSTAMRRGWKLSTSQIPQMVVDVVRKGDGEEWLRPGGGFGAVADDGYGVCYTVSGENSIFFHVSCHRSCGKTDAARFLQRIFDALHDLGELLQPRDSIQ